MGFLKIGIRWDCVKCDLDLYSKPSDSAEELYYKNPRTDEGFHFKDFQVFPNPVNGFEHIEYEKPVDLFRANASINFYSGSSEGGVNGYIRAFFEDKVYQKEFKIESNEGNKGADSASRNTSRYWKVYNLAELLGLKKDAVGEIPEQIIKREQIAKIISEPARAPEKTGANFEQPLRGVRILSPKEGDTIYASQIEQIPIERPIEGDVLGFSQGDVEKFGLMVEVSIYTSHWYPQGLVKVQADGSWILNTAYFGGAMHKVKALLMDKHKNGISSAIVNVSLIH